MKKMMYVVLGLLLLTPAMAQENNTIGYGTDSHHNGAISGRNSMHSQYGRNMLSGAAEHAGIVTPNVPVPDVQIPPQGDTTTVSVDSGRALLMIALLSLEYMMDSKKFDKEIPGSQPVPADQFMAILEEASREAATAAQLPTLPKIVKLAAMLKIKYNLDPMPYLQVIKECKEGLPSVKTMDAFGELIFSLIQRKMTTDYDELGGEDALLRSFTDAQKMFAGPYHLGQSGEDISLAALAERVQFDSPVQPLKYAKFFTAKEIDILNAVEKMGSLEDAIRELFAKPVGSIGGAIKIGELGGEIPAQLTRTDEDKTIEEQEAEYF